MEKSNFDRLLQRYVAGEVTDQERIKIEAWLEVMKTEDTTHLELTKADENKLFQKITSQRAGLEDVVAFRPGKERKLVTPWVVGIAASFFLVTLLSYVLWNFMDVPPDTLHVEGNDGIEKVILQDGTLVWLQAGSKLSYYEKRSDGTRHASLQGEALFEVFKDGAHPFIIHCGAVDVTVLGTSFNLIARSDSLELVVLTGRVNLTTRAHSVGVNVEPGQKIVYKNDEVIGHYAIDEKEIEVFTSHTEYNMQFTDATLEEVFQKIGDKFNVTISLSSPPLGRCRITADFTDHSLADTFALLAEILDIQYTIKKDVITVGGHHCQ